MSNKCTCKCTCSHTIEKVVSFKELFNLSDTDINNLNQQKIAKMQADELNKQMWNNTYKFESYVNKIRNILQKIYSKNDSLIVDFAEMQRDMHIRYTRSYIRIIADNTRNVYVYFHMRFNSLECSVVENVYEYDANRNRTQKQTYRKDIKFQNDFKAFFSFIRENLKALKCQINFEYDFNETEFFASIKDLQIVTVKETAVVTLNKLFKVLDETSISKVNDIFNATSLAQKLYIIDKYRQITMQII